MTEYEWDDCADPKVMLSELMDWKPPGSPGGFAGPTRLTVATDRKMRLYACACWRHLWTTPQDQAEATAVEEYVEGKAELPTLPGHWVNQPSAVGAAKDAADSMWPNDANPGAALLREIIGNPYRPILRIPVDCKEFFHHDKHIMLYDKWITTSVLSIAKAAYEDKDFVLLPLIADALEDAGCDSSICLQCETVKGVGGTLLSCNHCGGIGRILHPIVAHLRSPGPHVRGCWVLDALLGLS